MVVKGGKTSKLSTPNPSETPDPPPVGVAADSGEKTIAGIVSAAPLSAANPQFQTLRVPQGVSEGMLVKRVEPIYPGLAQQLRVQGVVQLQANLNKEGNVTNLKVLRGEALLAQPALNAVRQWKYKPYYLNGQPVEIQTEITVQFKLPN
jgi:periplasmic protein TonB